MVSDLDQLWDTGSPPALRASRNILSGEWDFPPIPQNSPLVHNYESTRVKEAGILYSFTIIHPIPKLGLAPYALGYVDFAGPIRLFGRLIGSDRPKIGERYAPVPDETFGYVFNLVQE